MLPLHCLKSFKSLNTCLERNIISQINNSIFEHYSLYQFCFSREQEHVQMLVSRRLEFNEIVHQALATATNVEVLAKAEEDERIRIANIDSFPSELGI